jgi:phosphoserine phosphatase
MDGTVIEEESLVEIAKILKKEQEIEELTTRAMTGEMDFKKSLQARLRILKGLTRQQVAAIEPTLCAGVLELAKWCHEQHVKIFLISGGFQEMAEPIAKQLGCSDFLANRFAWEEDIMQGTTDGDIIDANGKQQAVINWTKSLNFQKARTLVVGDGANDLLMMRVSGLAVGFRPKPVLWPELKIANHTGDHRFLLESLRQPHAAAK